MFNDSSLPNKVIQQSYKQNQHLNQQRQNMPVSDESSPLYNNSFGDKQNYKRPSVYGTSIPQQLVNTSASFSTVEVSQ